MCIAAPMKIIAIDNETHTARAELTGMVLGVNIALISPKVGDFVLVHAGCALEIVTPASAGEIAALFDELEDAYHDA